MKKKLAIRILAAILVLMVILFAGCSSQDQNKQSAEEQQSDSQSEKTEPTYIAIAGASQGGSNYVQASGIAKLVDKYVENVFATVEATAGSVENAKLVGSNQNQLGFVMADIVRAAYNGEAPFEEKYPDLRLAIVGQGAYLHFVVREENKDINSISDFKGKRIAVGAPGSSSAAKMVPAVLEAYGLTYDDVDEYFLGMSETAAALEDKTVDIGVFYSGMPVAGVQEVATTHKIKLIPIDEEPFNKLLSEHPYFHKGIVKANTYKNVDVDVPVLGVYSTVSSNIHVPEEIIYQILTAVHGHQDEWIEVHPGAAEFVPDLTAQEYKNFIPLHPGAEKYLKEKGIL